MIHKKNTITGELISHASINDFGAGYFESGTANFLPEWIDATQGDILETAKTEKLKELTTVYNSKELWIYTLKDNEGNTLTREQDWFLIKITKKVYFQNDKGDYIQKIIDNVDDIKTLINEKGLEISIQNSTIKTLIQTATTQEELDSIDIQGIFNQINKVIEIV